MTQHEDRAVWYEPHPVSPERKAEIRALGFRILDAVFKPADEENPDVPELKLDAAEKPANSTDANGDGKVTAADLKEALTAKGVTFKANTSKAELQALLDAAEKPADPQ